MLQATADLFYGKDQNEPFCTHKLENIQGAFGGSGLVEVCESCWGKTLRVVPGSLMGVIGGSLSLYIPEGSSHCIHKNLRSRDGSLESGSVVEHGSRLKENTAISKGHFIWEGPAFPHFSHTQN